MKNSSMMPLNKLSIGKYFTSLFFLSIILCAGGLAAYSAYRESSLAQDRDILAKVNTITRSISIEEVRTLSGNEYDVNLPEYITLKEKLMSIREANADIRFIYLMSLNKNNQVVFMVDSEPVSSEDYSPPGQIYDEAQPEIYETFNTGNSIVEPVSTDRWGRWVSGLALINDPFDQKEVLVGIDVEATRYIEEPWQKTLPFIFLMVIVLILAGAQFIVRRKELRLLESRSQFVAIASHELRSPLTGIRWAAETLLEDAALEPAKIEMVAGIRSSCLRLLSIVNDLLDLSADEVKLTNKKRFIKVDLASIALEAERSLCEVIQEKKINLIIKNTSPKPLFIMGDSARLLNVFTNLLSNSIKYSPVKSGVEVLLECVGKNALVSVLDHGIGIPKQDQQRVLKGFYRSANAKKLSIMGTGIGLYVSHKIILGHDGHLVIQSEEGKGTKVIVSFPLIN